MAATNLHAYCTLLTSDEYLPGAVVLAHSLKNNGTKKELAILVTLDSISASTVDELKAVYDRIIPVDRIVNHYPANLYLMNRPDLSSTFTKIALWKQTQYTHVVYIDADVVALRAPDELFNLPHSFAAVPDIGWPDCFNSGVLSLKPNMGDYYALLALAQRGISFDGADQGLLNMHFRSWERLSFTYNCTPSGNYQYAPAYRHFQSSISLVHYIGPNKPWIAGREQTRAGAGIYEELVGRWWAVYDKHYRLSSSSFEHEGDLGRIRAVQQYVTGETSMSSFAPRPTVSSDQTRAVEETTEPSMSEQHEALEQLDNVHDQPTPTVKQRRFSVDWDPTRQAPPAHSRPEAPDFPQDIYHMSQDRGLFQPPKPPEPPKGIGYEYPQTPPLVEPPKPIFPWEGRAPKATRVFAEDLPAPSASAALETTGSSAEVGTQSTDRESDAEELSPATPTGALPPDESFSKFSTANAWDSMPEIDRYISSLPQNRRAKVQVLLNKSTPLSSPPPQDSSVTVSTSDERPSGPERRPSKVTDFPTEIERPSLPVTPAPVRRPSFWGAERDEAGDLPAAEGVPEQSDWDPIARLLELQKRQADVLETVPAAEGEKREIPDREVISSAAELKPGQAAKLAQAAAAEAEQVAALQASRQPQGVEVGEETSKEATTRTEGASAAVGGRAQVIEEAVRAEPQEEALKGPAPMTAAAGAPGNA